MEGEKEQKSIDKSYFEKHKKPIVVLVAIISVVIVMVIPIIPIQYTVTETRTRNLRYSSEVYGIYNIPKFVNVTNTDPIGGTFSITMQKWYVNPIGQKQLEDTVTQSAFIPAGATHSFYLPEDWLIVPPTYSFTHSVTPPATQENYNVTKTEYKSILNLILESLK
jgi:hypothetical protein